MKDNSEETTDPPASDSRRSTLCYLNMKPAPELPYIYINMYNQCEKFQEGKGITLPASNGSILQSKSGAVEKQNDSSENQSLGTKAFSINNSVKDDVKQSWSTTKRSSLFNAAVQQQKQQLLNSSPHHSANEETMALNSNDGGSSYFHQDRVQKGIMIQTRSRERRGSQFAPTPPPPPPPKSPTSPINMMQASDIELQQQSYQQFKSNALKTNSNIVFVQKLRDAKPQSPTSPTSKESRTASKLGEEQSLLKGTSLNMTSEDPIAMDRSYNLSKEFYEKQKKVNILNRGIHQMQDGTGIQLAPQLIDNPHKFVTTVVHHEEGSRRYGPPRFNNSPEANLTRILDKRTYFSHYDVYNLNQIFGLPGEVERPPTENNTTMDPSRLNSEFKSMEFSQSRSMASKSQFCEGSRSGPGRRFFRSRAGTKSRSNSQGSDAQKSRSELNILEERLGDFTPTPNSRQLTPNSQRTDKTIKNYIMRQNQKRYESKLQQKRQHDRLRQYQVSIIEQQKEIQKNFKERAKAEDFELNRPESEMLSPSEKPTPIRSKRQASTFDRNTNHFCSKFVSGYMPCQHQHQFIDTATRTPQGMSIPWSPKGRSKELHELVSKKKEEYIRKLNSGLVELKVKKLTQKGFGKDSIFLTRGSRRRDESENLDLVASDFDSSKLETIHRTMAEAEKVVIEDNNVINCEGSLINTTMRSMQQSQSPFPDGKPLHGDPNLVFSSPCDSQLRARLGRNQKTNLQGENNSAKSPESPKQTRSPDFPTRRSPDMYNVSRKAFGGELLMQKVGGHVNIGDIMLESQSPAEMIAMSQKKQKKNISKMSVNYRMDGDELIESLHHPQSIGPESLLKNNLSTGRGGKDPQIKLEKQAGPNGIQVKAGNSQFVLEEDQIRTALPRFSNKTKKLGIVKKLKIKKYESSESNPPARKVEIQNFQFNYNNPSLTNSINKSRHSSANNQESAMIRERRATTQVETDQMFNPFKTATPIATTIAVPQTCKDAETGVPLSLNQNQRAPTAGSKSSKRTNGSVIFKLTDMFIPPNHRKDDSHSTNDLSDHRIIDEIRIIDGHEPTSSQYSRPVRKNRYKTQQRVNYNTLNFDNLQNFASPHDPQAQLRKLLNWRAAQAELPSQQQQQESMMRLSPSIRRDLDVEQLNHLIKPTISFQQKETLQQKMVRLRRINKASARMKSLQLTSSKTSSHLPEGGPSLQQIQKSTSKASKQSPPVQSRIVFNLERQDMSSKRQSTFMGDDQGSGEQLLLTNRPIYTQEIDSEAKFQTAKEIVKQVLGHTPSQNS